MRIGKGIKLYGFSELVRPCPNCGKRIDVITEKRKK
jgi:hypothetical protein